MGKWRDTKLEKKKNNNKKNKTLTSLNCIDLTDEIYEEIPNLGENMGEVFIWWEYLGSQ